MSKDDVEGVEGGYGWVGSKIRGYVVEVLGAWMISLPWRMKLT